MIVPKQGYKRQYAFGGTGIFDTIGNIIKGIVTSQAAKDLTKTALDASKNIVKTTASDVGNRLVKKVLTLSQTSPGFHVSAVKVFVNTVGKGEIARKEQFILFPQFSNLSENVLPFSSNLKLWSADSFEFGRV